MEEKHLVIFGEQIKELIPGTMEVKDNGDCVNIDGNMNVGVKGMILNIEVNSSRVKIKGTSTYKYPIAESAVNEFQEKTRKYIGYSIYVSGQSLSVSRVFSYQDESEVIAAVKDVVTVINELITTFESDCVDFLEKNPVNKSEEEYDPEKNVNLVNVDNSFQAVIMSEKDNEAYDSEHNAFTEKVFYELASQMDADVNDNSFTVYKGEKTLSVILRDEENEILVSVSIPVARNVGPMYKSYVSANYPELISSHNLKKSTFVIRAYITPDKYIPEETADMLARCEIAMDACITEYEQTLEKKDSTVFASDVQQILATQAETLKSKEAELVKKEEEMAKREQWMNEREDSLDKQIAELEQAKADMEAELQNERIRIAEKEEEMNNKIREYEKKDTKNILDMQRLASQVATLQNKQNMLGGDDESEEEIMRLKTKVQQLTSQKIILEKKLTEKITTRDSQIKSLSDTINVKERDLKKLEARVDDMVNSRVADESKKTAEYIAKLEKQVKDAGHTLAPDELIDYLQQFNPDVEYKKFHSASAKFVVYVDESLEIRVRFGETNYVDVSKIANVKDNEFRDLNSKHGEVKFFKKDTRVIARKYFKKTATAEEVDEVIEYLNDFFSNEK